MNHMVWLFLTGITTMAMLNANEALEIALWPEGVPGRIDDGTEEVITHDGGIARVKTVHEPALYAFPADEKTNCGAAVVICPGGGYGIIAIEHEGYDVARWLNSFGVSAFVVKYRMAPYRHPVPLMDAQQAVRIVRARASEWGIDAERIGIMGFSAGGHLASTVMTHGDRPVPAEGAPADVPCHANFAILGYPVISLVDEQLAHKGSARNLLGAEAGDPDLLAELSAEKQVDSTTPPAFFFHATDDRGVLPENSEVFADALRKAGVAAEVFLLESGGHGFGMRRVEWTAPCRDWLAEQGFLAGKD